MEKDNTCVGTTSLSKMKAKIKMRSFMFKINKTNKKVPISSFNIHSYELVSLYSIASVSLVLIQKEFIHSVILSDYFSS
jgi:hypothetical protein